MWAPRSRRSIAFCGPVALVVIWDVDLGTVSSFSRDRERMERALRAFDKHLAHPALPQRLTALLRFRGFDDVVMESHAFATNAIDPQAYLCIGWQLCGDFVAAQEGFGPEAAEALDREHRELGESGELYGSVSSPKEHRILWGRKRQMHSTHKMKVFYGIVASLMLDGGAPIWIAETTG